MGSLICPTGHCRRRKIRCLLAPDDPQGRCANCIRLKKECNFYPVEHNPDAPPSHTPGAKDSSPGHPLTPAASSPRHPQSLSGDKVGEFRAPYHPVSSAASNPGYGFHGESEIDSHQGATPSRSKLDFNVRFAHANTRSACAATIVSLPASHRHPMAAGHHLPPFIHHCRESPVEYELLATVTIHSHFSLR
jgi:hypothetical protein